jgi:hypothetical protein
MKTWIFLSAHFDDVVLSAGGLVWELTQRGDRDADLHCDSDNHAVYGHSDPDSDPDAGFNFDFNADTNPDWKHREHLDQQYVFPAAKPAGQSGHYRDVDQQRQRYAHRDLRHQPFR